MLKKNKALVLFSGGLDSMLAAKTLLEQGIEVIGLTFVSNFFNAEKAKAAAQALGIKHKIIDISQAELALVKNPPHGYGKHLNPCVDCHAQMVKLAGEIAAKEQIDIVATGEVLGQRPFSQNKLALTQVKELSGVDVLRPLSAKLLYETKTEKDGLVIRGKLHGIKGRSRERQMELAKRYGFKEYPSPAGGCLLTDPEFSERLIRLLEYWPDCNTGDVALLKYGRIFWSSLAAGKKALIIVGRHQRDNEALEKLAKKGDIMLQLKEINGPTSILRMSNVECLISGKTIKLAIPDKLKLSSLKLGEEKDENEAINIAGLLTGYYATKARGEEAEINITRIK